jgi:hypothetical protein
MSRKLTYLVIFALVSGCVETTHEPQTETPANTTRAQDPARRQAVLSDFARSMDDSSQPAAVRLGYAEQLATSYPDTPEGTRAKALIEGLKIEAKKERIGSQWRYESEAESMGRGTMYTASVTSSTPLNLGAPYAGTQWPVFVLRSHPKYGKDAILLIDEGQILCRSYEACTISISIDGKPPRNFEAYGAADNSTTSAFIRGHDRLAKEIMGGKEMKVQFPVYQNGEPVLTFNIEGFKPEKYRPAKGS